MAAATRAAGTEATRVVATLEAVIREAATQAAVATDHVSLG
jgi:hypothetical protein